MTGGTLRPYVLILALLCSALVCYYWDRAHALSGGGAATECRPYK